MTYLVAAAVLFPLGTALFRRPPARAVNQGLPPAEMAGEAIGGAQGPFFPSSTRTTDGELVPQSKFFMESETCGKSGCHVDVYQEFQGKPELFNGESHFNRAGRQRMAALLLHRLKGLGLVTTEYVYDRELEPGRVDDGRPELGSGWWAAEPWA